MGGIGPNHAFKRAKFGPGSNQTQVIPHRLHDLGQCCLAWPHSLRPPDLSDRARHGLRRTTPDLPAGYLKTSLCGACPWAGPDTQDHHENR